MGAAQPHPARHEPALEFAPIPLQRQVLGATIGVNEDGIRSFEDGKVVDPLAVHLFGRPALGDQDGAQTGNPLESLLQQDRSGAKFVHQRRMARRTSDHHQLAFHRRRQRERSEKTDQQGPKAERSFHGE
jgi:hypothetical protein